MSALMMIAAGASLMNVFACEASGTKQEVGAAIGAVVGGAIGNRLSEDNRTLGTVVGAAAGAMVGQWIGCRLQKADQQKLAAAAERTIVTGQPTSWSTPENAAAGTVRVISTTTTSAPETLALAPGVTAPQTIEVIAARYSVRSTANLRPTPATSGRPVGRLAAGETVDVVGRVSGQPWLLVARGGVGVGYVSEALLTPLGAMPAAAPAAGGSPTTAVRLCRTIEQTTTAGGQSQSDRWVACQADEGAWDVRRA